MMDKTCVVVLVVAVSFFLSSFSVALSSVKEEFFPQFGDYLNPDDDTCISENQPDEIGGSLHSLCLRGPCGGGMEMDSLVKFDLSWIYPDSTILTAKLHLYYYSYHDGNPHGHVLDVYRITSGWDEETACWNTQPTACDVASDSVSCPYTNNTWVTWDVTGDVQQVVSGGCLNYGWMLKDLFENETAYSLYYSKEATGMRIPVLEVQVQSHTFYVGGSGVGNFSRIQDAIDASTNGDTILICDGVYHENVNVTKSIVLCAVNDGKVAVDGGGMEDVVYVAADNVTIRGLKVQDSGDNWCYDAGIEVHANGCVLEGNNIQNNSLGILIQGRSVSDIRIENNTVMYNGEGMYLSDWWDWLSNIHVVNNVVCLNKEDGILITGDDCIISSNQIIDNPGIGLSLQTENSLVCDNTIAGSYQQGISLFEWCYENTITRNNILHNGDGIRTASYCNNNLIYTNNFMNNTRSAYDEEHNAWNNTYRIGGNYWDDYKGSDQDHDGIGDTPYSIPGGTNKDNYPLIEPYRIKQFDLDCLTNPLRVMAQITNNADTPAYNVHWSITINASFIRRGRCTEATLPGLLPPGGETVIHSNRLFGFGRASVTVSAWADNIPYITQSRPAILFLCFLIYTH